jgi:O-antigen ligase
MAWTSFSAIRERRDGAQPWQCRCAASFVRRGMFEGVSVFLRTRGATAAFLPRGTATPPTTHSGASQAKVSVQDILLIRVKASASLKQTGTTCMPHPSRIPALMLFGFLPIAIAPGAFFCFDSTPKAAILMLSSAWLIMQLRSTQGFTRLLQASAGRRLAAALAASTLSVVVSCCLSDRATIAIAGTGWQRLGGIEYAATFACCLCIASHVTHTRTYLRSILRILTVTSGALGLYGIAQYLGWDPFLNGADYHFTFGRLYIVRPPGTMGHAVYFGDYLACMAFLSLASATLEDRDRWRRVAEFTAVVCGVALFLTGTRAGLVGVAAGTIFLIWARSYRVPIRRFLAGLGTLGLAAAVFLSPQGELVRNRMELSSGDPAGGARLLVWRDALSMAGHHLLAGIGPGLFASEFPKWQSLQLALAYPDSLHETAHNILIDALVSQGLPGALLLAGTFALGVYYSLRWPACRRTGALLGAGLVSLFAAQQFSVFVLPTAVLFFTLVALACSGATEEAQDPQPQTRQYGTILRIARVPVASLFVVLAIQFVYAGITWGTVARAIEGGDFESAMATYRRAVRLSLPETGADLWYGRAVTGALSRSRDEWQRRLLCLGGHLKSGQ